MLCKNKGDSKVLSGSGNPSWSGGKSFQPYDVRWNDNLRYTVIIRDKYTCQLCGKKRKYKERFCVHHLDYNKMNSVADNLVYLCESCHLSKMHTREEKCKGALLEVLKRKIQENQQFITLK